MEPRVFKSHQPAGQMGGQVEPRVFKSHQPAGQMGGQVEPRVFTSDQPAGQMEGQLYRQVEPACSHPTSRRRVCDWISDQPPALVGWTVVRFPGCDWTSNHPLVLVGVRGLDTQVCDWISDHPLALVGGRGSDAQVCGWISGELFSSSPARKLASHGRLAAVWALFPRFGRWLGDLRSDVGCSFIWPTRELIVRRELQRAPCSFS